MTRITAHAGCEGTRPNSIENLTAAVSCGADTVEVDLRLRGSEAVLSHDPLRAGADYVRLEEALALLQPSGVRINCDLKEEAVFAPALALFRAFGMEDRMECTGNYPLTAVPDENACYQVYYNAENVPGVPLADMIDAETAERLSDWLANAHAPVLAGFNVDITQLTEEALAVFAARSVELFCWTVDEAEDLAFCLRGGIGCITTNRVRAACAARAALGTR